MSAMVHDLPAAAEIRGRDTTRSYQGVLSAISWCAFLLVVATFVAWQLAPRVDPLLTLQRAAWYKQLTGYVLVGLLAFDLSLAMIKRRLVRGNAHRALQIAHRVLGISMLGLLVLHAGFAHTGFLDVTFAIAMLVVLTGAVPNLLPARRVGSWGRWSTAVHIAAGCLLGASVVMHLYFVYYYAA